MVRRAHRMIAGALGVFLCLHIASHLMILGGVEWHQRALDAGGRLYRYPPMEAALFTIFAAQIALGVALAHRGGWRRQWWARLQRVTGLLIAVFVVAHLGALINVRLAGEVKTSTYWAASVVSRAPFVWGFAPYYWLGVAAVFAHVAAALARRRKIRVAQAMIAAGMLSATVIVAGLMGAFHPITLPPAYEAYLRNWP